MAEPSVIALLNKISYQLGEIIARLDSTATDTGTEDIMSYDYLEVEIPANENDFEVSIPVPASVTYITVSHAVTFRVNEISASQIPWRAEVEFRISPMRTERLYVTTGASDTTIQIRTLLTEADMSRKRLRKR